MNLTKDEHLALEELLNEELLEYLKSGYNLTDSYPVLLRGLIQKLGCSEIYPFDKWYGEDEEE